MGITMKEIAELAGVHKSTVDKVIHNRPGVSEKKREEIRRLLEQYDYGSNPLAKALNYQKKKMSVAVILPRVDASAFLKNGMELVRQDFSSFNIAVQYYEMGTEEAEKQAELLRKLREDRISGIVLLPIESEAVRGAMRELAADGIPVVTVNTDIDAPRFCYSGQDMEKGGRVAAGMMAMIFPDGGKLGIITSRMNQANKIREKAFLSHVGLIKPELKLIARLELEEKEEIVLQEAEKFFRINPDLDALYITCGNVKTICQGMKIAENEKVLVKKPKIVCHERYPAILELQADGTVFATINGELHGQGRIAMRILFEYLVYDRRPDKESVLVGNEILIKENV